MNINTIRTQLSSLKNEDHSFCYYGLRGQNDLFDGRIISVYPRVFLIQTNASALKCFSYSDFATKLLRILR